MFHVEHSRNLIVWSKAVQLLAGSKAANRLCLRPVDESRMFHVEHRTLSGVDDPPIDVQIGTGRKSHGTLTNEAWVRNDTAKRQCETADRKHS